MNEEQQLILKYLSQYATGYENRKSSSEIRDTLNLESGGPTKEHIRDLIRDMIFNHSCTIGSLMFQKGYWLIENELELNKVIDQLNSRSDGVRERANALQRNWDNRNE